MADSTERLNKFTVIGIAGVLITVLLGKGCQFDVACVGCIRIVAEESVTETITDEVTPNEVLSDQVRKDDNSLIDCSQLVIEPPQPLRPITKLEPGQAKAVGHMALHIARQRTNLLAYGERVKAQVDEFNKYCK